MGPKDGAYVQGLYRRWDFEHDCFIEALFRESVNVLMYGHVVVLLSCFLGDSRLFKDVAMILKQIYSLL